MNDDPFNLEQIVVTATRTEKNKNTPVITQVITAKQIEERGTGNIQDLLTQEVPDSIFRKSVMEPVSTYRAWAPNISFS